jgi:hypothetical protein
LPLLALLTTERLLVVNTNLVVVARCEAGGRALLSVAWLGSCVLALADSGQVLYWPALGAASRGGALLARPLLAFAPAAVAGGAFAAVLPDRLVLVAVPSRPDGRPPRPRLYTRPLLPLEPLLVGLAVAASASSAGPEVAPPEAARRRAALGRLASAAACRHAPLEAKVVGEGPGVHAGASAVAVAALHRLGLHAHAAAVAGVGPAAQLDAYARRPWLGRAAKAAVAGWAGRWGDAAVEALGGAPELQARARAALDQWPPAAPTARPPPHAQAVARVLAVAAAAAAAGASDAAALAMEVVGGARAAQARPAGGTGAAVAAAPKVEIASARARAALLRPLRLHRAEEWLGRARAECAAPDDLVAGIFGDDPAAADGGPGVEGLPEGWTAGVGAGKKDEQNLGGYWRFSEGESSEAGLAAGAVCADLSGMGVAAQVVGREMRLEPCSCSLLDEGEDAATHVAFDLCFPDGASTAAEVGRAPRGLLLGCARGSALDVGLFHRDPHRAALTVELWFKVPRDSGDEGTRDEGSGDEPETAQPLPWAVPATLAARRLAGFEVWALRLQPDGALVVSLAGCPEALASRPGAVAAGQWAHVALTLDSRGAGWEADKPTVPQPCDLALFVDGAPAADGRAAAALPAQAARVLAALDAAEASHVAVGPDLGHGCRITELRFWACLRKVRQWPLSCNSHLHRHTPLRVFVSGGRHSVRDGKLLATGGQEKDDAVLDQKGCHSSGRNGPRITGKPCAGYNCPPRVGPDCSRRRCERAEAARAGCSRFRLNQGRCC